MFPLWWSGGDDATGRGFKAFIPLFIWQSDQKARTATLVTLAGGYTKDDAAGTRMGLIWPLLTYWSRSPNSETNIVTPLYISHYSKTEHSMTRLATLFYQREDPQGSTTTFFPLFAYFHDAATDASALVTPLGGYRSGPRDTTAVFLTFYWRTYKADGNGSVGWNAGLFPLLMFGRNKGTAHAIVFPLFWHLSDTDSSTTALLPLFYWHRDGEGLHARDAAFCTWAAAAARATSCSSRWSGTSRASGAAPPPRTRRSATTTRIRTAGAPASARWCRCCSCARGRSSRTSRWCRSSGTSPTGARTRRPPSS